jgi:glycosyltransferase involved in cell wall biosynthesis/predicted O-methyltransferase YrrM
MAAGPASSYLNNCSFWQPDYLEHSAWLAHAPFAFWLVSVLRPRILVELGTYRGFSYFAFCQAVHRLGLDAKCHAIDSWLGDEHGGFYGPEVFSQVDSYNASRYASFSTLVRADFSEAARQFDDGSIDLIHFDGRHYYKDIKRDFDNWATKLSDRGVALFHDTQVRERGFGVHRFWAELSAVHPTMEFLHGHGLGVAAIGKQLPPAFAEFIAGCQSGPYLGEVRAVYARLGQVVEDAYRLSLAGDQSEVANAKLIRQVLAASAARDEEVAALKAELAALTAEATRQAGEIRAGVAPRADNAREIETAKAEPVARAGWTARPADEARALEDQRSTRFASAPRGAANRQRKGRTPPAEHGPETVDQLRRQLASRDKRIERLEETVRRQMQRLQRVTRRLGAQKTALAAMKGSLSWRLTAPTREIRRALARLRPAKAATARRQARGGVVVPADEPTILDEPSSAVEPVPAMTAEVVPVAVTRRVPAKRRRRKDRPAGAKRHGPKGPAANRPLFPVVITGMLPRIEGAPTVLLCAHQAGQRLFGSERSFLDVLESLRANGFNVVAVLPRIVNAAYAEEIKKSSIEIVSFPYAWWTRDEPINQTVVEAFAGLIEKHRVDVVHVNTIMPREPLVAARRMGVRSIVHVRELVEHDPDLCAHIGESPAAITHAVLQRADYIFANSATTGRAYATPDRTFVIPNCVDLAALDLANVVADGRINIGMISSNLEKKGVLEFVDVAREMVDIPAARFVLIGTVNPLIERLMALQEIGDVPPNIHFAGYSESSAEAMAQTNIVLNLSRFQESFGRTALEAMAARRAVVAFDWGAVSELIADGENGYLVPYGNVGAVVDRLGQLCADPRRIREMGEAGRRIAEARYSKAAMAAAVGAAYQRILAAAPPPASAEPEPEPARRSAFPDRRVSVVVPNFNYERFIEERITSIVDQTHRPAEIIFLDDASTDNSVELARSLLERSGIEHRIIVNPTNRGTFAQWARGLAEASGDFVWIAEADDASDPRFLETLLAAFDDPAVVLAYCRSTRIGETGDALPDQNARHMDDVVPGGWSVNYVELGLREVVDKLAYRNTIPNVSACLIRKSALWEGYERDLVRLRSCGDWLFHAHLLRSGKIAFFSAPLNRFRRHRAGVTISRGRDRSYLDELIAVRKFIAASFPVHPRQLDRMDAFLDSDYRIEGVTRNSATPEAVAARREIEARISGNRRFALVTTNNGSHNGGSEILWQETALRLRELGHDVVVLIKNWLPRPPLFDRLERAGVRLYLKEQDGLEAIVAFRPDLCVVSTGDQDEGTAYFARLIEAGIPYVIVNQLTKEERFWPIREKLVDNVRRGYLSAARCFFTCANNHAVQESRLNHPIPNWSRHYNPFHIDRDSVPQFPPLDGGLRLAVPAKLLFIHKGQDLLIEALAAEKWKGRGLAVSFYGDGPDAGEIAERIKRHGLSFLRLCGRVDDIAEIWRANHAFVMPSRMEGMPIMLVSGMMSARVPIVTRIGGHDELVDDGRTGFIADAPTVEDIDDALERAYQARDRWQAIGVRARERVLAWLPADPVGDFVTKLLAECREPNEEALPIPPAEAAAEKDRRTAARLAAGAGG